MPVKLHAPSGKPMYDTKEAAERAYKGYLASKGKKGGK